MYNNYSVVVSYTYDAWGKPISTTGSMATTLGTHNPLHYRGYVYDTETGFYYLQSRYYDPSTGRFINADAQLNPQDGLLGNNMFAYCLNNPVMLSDQSGHAPEWWQWVLSGSMVVVGVAFVATGFGGVAGGTLICAGVNSIVGSYISEESGGSSVAGWVGGMITGGLCGTGAGIAGQLMTQAINSTGVACISNLLGFGASAFGFGFTGSAIGQSVAAAIDDRKVDTKNVICSSIYTGMVNCLSGIGAGMGMALADMPTISTTSTIVVPPVLSDM